ncbi:MAG: hypothetical protein KJO31_02190 [Gammaproteobacteria bacterium]|nr:hypothetical protein [Gammaproteobacteria bacterium]
MSVAVYRHNDSVLEDSAGQAEREGYDLELLYALDDNWSFGAGHHYSNLGVELSGLPTNGHLHTTVFAVHRQSPGDRINFRMSFAPALSGSSNVMRDPGEYSSNTFQLLAALVWRRELTDAITLRYGVCGDHRFGDYAVYPSLGVDWKPGTDWTVELGFPESRITYRVSNGVSLSLGAAPDGNEWHVKNKNLDRESQLVYEGTLVEGTWNWQLNRQLRVSAKVGRLFDNRYDLTLQNGSQVQLSSAADSRFAASIEWQFQ